jgi:hypothetical protein
MFLADKFRQGSGTHSRGKRANGSQVVSFQFCE